MVNSVEISKNAYAAHIQSCIHSVDRRIYSNKIVSVIEEAISIVNKIENPRARIPQQKYLRNIIRFAKLLLYPSRELRTDRVFAHGHWVNLTKDARTALNGNNWVEADLVSSQLAIVSKIWNIPYVHELLSQLLLDDISIWKYLQRQLGISDRELLIVKPILKECVYSICFGKSRKKLADDLGKELLSCNASFDMDSLFSMQIFVELFSARSKKFAEIKDKGGQVDAFEVWRPIECSADSGLVKESIRSVMARVAQSWELLIISEAFNVLNSSSKNRIVVFAHDGFTMTKENGFYREHKEITSRVNSKLNDFGIPSALKWEL